MYKALGALQAVHSKSELDLINIESVFTTLEISELIGKLPSFETSEIPKVIASLKEVIVSTLETTIKFPVRSSLQIFPAEPYDDFVGLISYLLKEAHPAQSVCIITFNYDIAIDLALYVESLGPDYCLADAKALRDTVPLLKLHGSLNWASTSKSHEVIPLELSQYFKSYRLNPISRKLRHA